MSNILTKEQFKREADKALEDIRQLAHIGIDEAPESYLEEGTAIAAVVATANILFERLANRTKRKPNEFN